MAFWFITDRQLIGRRFVFKLIVAMPLIYISLIVFLYNITDDFGGGWSEMIDIIGLPLFVLSGISIAAILWNAISHPAGLTSPERQRRRAFVPDKTAGKR